MVKKYTRFRYFRMLEEVLNPKYVAYFFVWQNETRKKLIFSIGSCIACGYVFVCRFASVCNWCWGDYITCGSFVRRTFLTKALWLFCCSNAVVSIWKLSESAVGSKRLETSLFNSKTRVLQNICHMWNAQKHVLWFQDDPLFRALPCVQPSSSGVMFILQNWWNPFAFSGSIPWYTTGLSKPRIERWHSNLVVCKKACCIFIPPMAMTQIVWANRYWPLRQLLLQDQLPLHHVTNKLRHGLSWNNVLEEKTAPEKGVHKL